LRRLLASAAPAGAAIATLAVAAGAAFGDRPTVFVALLALATVAAVFLLCQGLATRILARLDAAVTERDRLEAELDAAHRTKEEFRNLASHDDLTGLPNRSLLHDRLGLAIAHAHRQASHLAVLFLDLDDFKAVNDLVTSADANMYRDKQGAAPAPSSEVASAIEAIARKAQGRVILPSR
jgi:predicted signal transduction protein with EAL and GGDEF domain